jgi:hypothetical protein
MHVRDLAGPGASPVFGGGRVIPGGRGGARRPARAAGSVRERSRAAVAGVSQLLQPHDGSDAPPDWVATGPGRDRLLASGVLDRFEDKTDPKVLEEVANVDP